MKSRNAMEDLLCENGEILLSHSDVGRELFGKEVIVEHGNIMVPATISSFKMLQRGRKVVPCMVLRISGALHIKRLTDINFNGLDNTYVIVSDDAFGLEVGPIYKQPLSSIVSMPSIDKTFTIITIKGN